ncbi:MAG: hypothetical protein Q8P83_00365 [bacterium]|nr:hypothetical protein [bacterium]
MVLEDKVLNRLTSGLFLVALIFGAVFLFSNQALAALNLPQTSCDDAQVDAILPGFGTSAHITSNMLKEDGETAFTYGSDNNSFVTTSGDIITLHPNLLFDPTSNPGSVIKLYAFNASCSVVFGFGPISGSDGDAPIQVGPNTVSYNTLNNQVVFNNGITHILHPNLLVRYIWLEVWDGKNTADKKATYSYLVDIQDVKNPTGSVEEPSEPPGKRPVLIIPGIMGSKLYEGGEEVWPDLSSVLNQTKDQFLLDSLELDSNGNSINEVSVGEVIKKITLVNIDTFEGLTNVMEDNGYILGENYDFFPYDWRLDLDTNVELLNNKIQEIQGSFSSINIIAHSMGGLLVKDYISIKGDDKIDKLIFVGTPHLGSPKSAKVLLSGDTDIPFNILNRNTIKELGLNMPSVYQLLPNQQYFDSFTGYINLSSSNDIQNFLSYNSTKVFFQNKQLNLNLLNKAEEFFSRSLYDLDFSNIDMYNIIGCGVGTQAGYRFRSFSDSIRGIGYTSGDKTVPLLSARYIDIPFEKKFYANKVEHGKLPSDTHIRELILDILEENQLSLDGINLSNAIAICDFKGRQLTWKSPVEIHIYDQNGNHAGPIPGGFENNLPGVDYEIIGEEKFIFIPTDDGNIYTITALGQEQGTFDLVISEIDNGDVVSSTVYNDIPIMESSEVVVDINNQVSFDYGGDGSFSVLVPSSFLTGNAVNDLTPPISQVSVTGTLLLNDWFLDQAEVTMTAVDDLSGVLETKYSLDGGNTFMNYSGPFSINTPGINQIQFYSVDNAGNNEDTQKAEVKIDNAPPEFKLWFDAAANEIIFDSIDDGDPDPTIICAPTECTATDNAGNMSILKFMYVSNKKTHNLILQEITYDTQTPQRLRAIFNVQFSERRGVIKKFNQMLTSKDFISRVSYNTRKDQTDIFVQKPKERATRETVDSIKLLHIITNSGKIEMEIK